MLNFIKDHLLVINTILSTIFTSLLGFNLFSYLKFKRDINLHSEQLNKESDNFTDWNNFIQSLSNKTTDRITIYDVIRLRTALGSIPILEKGTIKESLHKYPGSPFNNYAQFKNTAILCVEKIYKWKLKQETNTNFTEAHAEALRTIARQLGQDRWDYYKYNAIERDLFFFPRLRAKMAWFKNGKLMHLYQKKTIAEHTAVTLKLTELIPDISYQSNNPTIIKQYRIADNTISRQCKILSLLCLIGLGLSLTHHYLTGLAEIVAGSWEFFVVTLIISQFNGFKYYYFLNQDERARDIHSPYLWKAFILFFIYTATTLAIILMLLLGYIIKYIDHNFLATDILWKDVAQFLGILIVSYIIEWLVLNKLSKITDSYDKELSTL
ncbi:hypothetical protein [Convivina intestini]|uniref:hypothetical protein n=1 Tax=Convivina intestini TaxID=1505726 RepID=UPI002010BF13|nr:hypothetical protein [Convivina intestini]CAH1857053.1 hypothetical protein R078131_01527 [Convivina intestini]